MCSVSGADSAVLQMRLISWAELEKTDLVVPADLSSTEVGTDAVRELEEFDDLDIISSDELLSEWDRHHHSNSNYNTTKISFSSPQSPSSLNAVKNSPILFPRFSLPGMGKRRRAVAIAIPSTSLEPTSASIPVPVSSSTTPRSTRYNAMALGKRIFTSLLASSQSKKNSGISINNRNKLQDHIFIASNSSCSSSCSSSRNDFTSYDDDSILYPPSPSHHHQCGQYEDSKPAKLNWDLQPYAHHPQMPAIIVTSPSGTPTKPLSNTVSSIDNSKAMKSHSKLIQLSGQQVPLNYFERGSGNSVLDLEDILRVLQRTRHCNRKSVHALRTILNCPSCRETLATLSSVPLENNKEKSHNYREYLELVDMSLSSSSTLRDNHSYEPKERRKRNSTDLKQQQGNPMESSPTSISKFSNCILCQCSYDETKSYVLSKLAKIIWMRPCRYQVYGCESYVRTESSNLFFEKRLSNRTSRDNSNSNSDGVHGRNTPNCKRGSGNVKKSGGCETNIPTKIQSPSKSYGSNTRNRKESQSRGESQHTHKEEECEFQPLHCPFMLCRQKFPKASLIKHLHSEHHLSSQDGPSSEGTIFCLPNNKRRICAQLISQNKRASSFSSSLIMRRANYSLDPTTVSCFGHIFILRILRRSSSWYIWVWTLKQENGEGDEKRRTDAVTTTTTSSSSTSTITTTATTSTTTGDEKSVETFPYSIRLQRVIPEVCLRDRFGDSLDSKSRVGARQPLDLFGTTLSLRIPMEEILTEGMCTVIPEEGSLFDCSEENNDDNDDGIIVNFSLVMYPNLSSSSR